jgi:hypothetical protein
MRKLVQHVVILSENLAGDRYEVATRITGGGAGVSGGVWRREHHRRARRHISVSSGHHN